MDNPNKYLRYWEIKVRKAKWVDAGDYLTFYLHCDFNNVLAALQHIGTKDIYTNFSINEIDEEEYLLNIQEENYNSYRDDTKSIHEIYSEKTRGL